MAGVDQAEAVGAEQSHALGGAEAGYLRLEFGARGAGLAKTRGDDGDRFGSGAEAVLYRLENSSRRDRDDTKVDRPPRRVERGEAGLIEERRRGRVHRHDAAGEPARDQVGEDVVPDFISTTGFFDAASSAASMKASPVVMFSR